jgi:hypothetical protein
MTKLGILMGSWIALNAVVAAALLSRRPVPHLRERLFRWVVGHPRKSRPQELAHSNAHRAGRR